MALTFFSVSNSNLGNTSKREIKKLTKTSAELLRDAVVFSLENKEKIDELFRKNQSLLSLSLFCSKNKEVSELSLEGLKEKFTDEAKIKYSLDVLGVKGNENRIDLARQIYPNLEKELMDRFEIEADIDHKNPDFLFQLYFTGKEYLFGLQLNNKYFDSRSYRLYPHQASFKGDFAYFLLDQLGPKKDENVLALFSKDGVLAIEAALLLDNLPVRKIKTKDYISKIKYFEPSKLNDSKQKGTSSRKIIAFEEAMANNRAAKNHAKLVSIPDKIEFIKAPLEDLDLKVENGSIDKVYIHMTRKYEAQLNEIYYQLNHVLKKGAKTLFICRPVFELSVPNTFKQISLDKVSRGNSFYNLYVLEKL